MNLGPNGITAMIKQESILLTQPKPNGSTALLAEAMRRAAQDVEKRQVATKNKDNHLKEGKSVSDR